MLLPSAVRDRRTGVVSQFCRGREMHGWANKGATAADLRGCAIGGARVVANLRRIEMRAVGGYLRRHHLALVAMFIALGWDLVCGRRSDRVVVWPAVRLSDAGCSRAESDHRVGRVPARGDQDLLERGRPARVARRAWGARRGRPRRSGGSGWATGSRRRCRVQHRPVRGDWRRRHDRRSKRRQRLGGRRRQQQRAGHHLHGVHRVYELAPPMRRPTA